MSTIRDDVAYEARNLVLRKLWAGIDYVDTQLSITEPHFYDLILDRMLEELNYDIADPGLAVFRGQLLF